MSKTSTAEREARDRLDAIRETITAWRDKIRELTAAPPIVADSPADLDRAADLRARHEQAIAAAQEALDRAVAAERDAGLTVLGFAARDYWDAADREQDRAATEHGKYTALLDQIGEQLAGLGIGETAIQQARVRLPATCPAEDDHTRAAALAARNADLIGAVTEHRSYDGLTLEDIAGIGHLPPGSPKRNRVGQAMQRIAAEAYTASIRELADQPGRLEDPANIVGMLPAELIPGGPYPICDEADLIDEAEIARLDADRLAELAPNVQHI